MILNEDKDIQLGKVKSDFGGLEFCFYDNGLNPSNKKKYHDSSMY